MDNFRSIIFNGINLKSFGLYITKDTDYFDVTMPEVNELPIQGSRKGAAIQNLGRYKNKERTFNFKTIPSKIPCEDKDFCQMLNDWVVSTQGGYKKLMDSNRPGYYCRAYIKQINKIERVRPRCFKISITFSCEPFWRSKLGDNVVITEVSNTTPVGIWENNYEKADAYPLITVEAFENNQPTAVCGFHIQVNSTVYTVANPSASGKTKIVVDSEKLNTYSGSTPLNQYVGFTDYPALPSGENHILFSAGDGYSLSQTLKFSLKPRWRCY